MDGHTHGPHVHSAIPTLDLFKTLTRSEMYSVLSKVDPLRAKGKSRARKEVLIQEYTEALLHSIPDEPTRIAKPEESTRESISLTRKAAIRMLTQSYDPNETWADKKARRRMLDKLIRFDSLPSDRVYLFRRSHA